MKTGKLTKKRRAELNAEFDAALRMKEFAENQVRKTAGTRDAAEAENYLQTVKDEITRIGFLL